MNQNNVGQREKRLRQAYEYIETADWGEREAAVQLALKALLVMRGALNPRVIDIKIYSTLAKYVRASNAETLSALIDDVLDNISPQFIPHPALGGPVEDIYATDAASNALALLKDETIPLVIMLKKIYQQFVESEEEESKEEA
jgi:HEPN domain-containing protein